MRHRLWILVFATLSLCAVPGFNQGLGGRGLSGQGLSGAAWAQSAPGGMHPIPGNTFYGTGSSYTGGRAPIQTLDAIDAETRRQSAIDGQLRSQRLQLETDRRRAATSGANLKCWGKAASTTNCASKPMPQYDRRIQTLEQNATGAEQREQERLQKLQEQR